jgi:hypothetical protein
MTNINYVGENDWNSFLVKNVFEFWDILLLHIYFML